MPQKPCFTGRAFNLVSANFISVPLIVEYHRPESLAEAVELLQQPDHVALAGGTVVNADRNRSQLVAVDLQSLGLDVVSREASRVQFGAMCSLVRCVDCLKWKSNAVEISWLRRHAASFPQHSGQLAQLAERLQPAEEKVSCLPP